MVIEYEKAVEKNPQKTKTQMLISGICEEFSAQFLEISIFSGKAKEHTTAAKETLPQSATLPLSAPTVLPGFETQSWKMGIPNNSGIATHNSSVFSWYNSVLYNDPITSSPRFFFLMCNISALNEMKGTK